MTVELLSEVVEDGRKYECDQCGAFDGENRCTIYPTRPNACVGFEAGSEKCQDVRLQVGLEPLKPTA